MPKLLTSNKIMFGQYLIEKGAIDQSVLFNALKLQNQEALARGSLRPLGTILLENFNIFRDKQELKRNLSAHARMNQ